GSAGISSQQSADSSQQSAVSSQRSAVSGQRLAVSLFYSKAVPVAWP
ncbi:MAG: hypothetical protein F6K20_28605, partial [Moorea sp. SIO2C4]|nr:hypothetical protein [Moorena sp. SIO2C4]